ncbi:MAG: hypothetical protein Q8R79_08925 [Legionellaceae bacterium]|nr:hypothetical protein [Legionellaceae bacterium]
MAYSRYKKSLIAVLALSCLPSLSSAAEKMHLRGDRYCEILFSKSFLEYSVYNTWGLNNCPENLWKKVTIEKVSQDTGASTILLNGPRYWVIDGFTNTTLINPQTKIISGLPVREAGVLRLGIFDLFKSRGPYHQRTVARQTTWIYEAGKRVYELIDPKGQIFVMQSYSTQHQPQTMASLVNLAKKLHLPADWQFKTGILKKQEQLEAINQSATVIQDDLSNTYQLATHDFL